MTNEEFDKLPLCTFYRNPGASDGCSRHPNNNDDWDELEDPCAYCSGNKWRNTEFFMNMTLEEAQKRIEETFNTK